MQTFVGISCRPWVAGMMLLLILSVGARPQAREVSSQRAPSPDSHDHLLLLYNTHTAERIDIVYRRGEAYIPEALAKLDFFLRDHRTGGVSTALPASSPAISQDRDNHWQELFRAKRRARRCRRKNERFHPQLR